ncbi:hypothetical protein B0T25DRAFT_540697 [Lasiosphaeria hispida]|uniref:Uncharacterized protein n=1 Tax=Lasiosphaeria hispida TaxID=260671 RepID=A0AAJ0HNF7_9PEZI|nr:hypothetical protein B0T25DRAFT_540697 [Lasiosphaeria hispida]
MFPLDSGVSTILLSTITQARGQRRFLGVMVGQPEFSLFLIFMLPSCHSWNSSLRCAWDTGSIDGVGFTAVSGLVMVIVAMAASCGPGDLMRNGVDVADTCRYSTVPSETGNQ